MISVSSIDFFVPPTSEEITFTIEDVQKVKCFTNQLHYISESLNNIIQKHF